MILFSFLEFLSTFDSTSTSTSCNLSTTTTTIGTSLHTSNTKFKVSEPQEAPASSPSSSKIVETSTATTQNSRKGDFAIYVCVHMLCRTMVLTLLNNGEVRHSSLSGTTVVCHIYTDILWQ